MRRVSKFKNGWIILILIGLIFRTFQKNGKMTMKNQPNMKYFENILKHLTFVRSVFILLPFFTNFIFFPEILGVERYNLYISKTNIFEFDLMIMAP